MELELVGTARPSLAAIAVLSRLLRRTPLPEPAPFTPARLGCGSFRTGGRRLILTGLMAKLLAV